MQSFVLYFCSMCYKDKSIWNAIQLNKESYMETSLKHCCFFFKVKFIGVVFLYGNKVS